MRGGDDEIDAAANVEMALDDHPLRLAGRNHRVEDDVGDIFVEVAFISKAPQILLDRLRFKALFAGRILDGNRGEIGLPGHRAQRCEFNR